MRLTPKLGIPESVADILGRDLARPGTAASRASPPIAGRRPVGPVAAACPLPGSCLPDNRNNLRAHRSHLRARRTSLPSRRTCIPARRTHTPPSSQALTRHAGAAFRVVAPAYRTMRDASQLAGPTDHHIASAFPTIASSSIRGRKRQSVNDLQVRICRKVTAEGREGYWHDSGGNSRDAGGSCRNSGSCRRGSGSRCRPSGCNRRGW